MKLKCGVLDRKPGFSFTTSCQASTNGPKTILTEVSRLILRDIELQGVAKAVVFVQEHPQETCDRRTSHHVLTVALT
jgi:hypothetical protein